MKALQICGHRENDVRARLKCRARAHARSLEETFPMALFFTKKLYLRTKNSFMTPCEISSNFHAHPITLLFQKIGGRMHGPPPTQIFGNRPRRHPPRSPPMDCFKTRNFVSCIGIPAENCSLPFTYDGGLYNGCTVNLTGDGCNACLVVNRKLAHCQRGKLSGYLLISSLQGKIVRDHKAHNFFF